MVCQKKFRDLDSDPGKILAAGVRSSSRTNIDIRQYYDIINGSESPHYYHTSYVSASKTSF